MKHDGRWFPSWTQIIKYVDQALESLEIVYRVHAVAVEGLADQNGHIQHVVGDGKGGRWEVAWSKCEGCEWNIERNMFLRSDLLKLYLNQKRNITEYFPDVIMFLDEKNSRYEEMR